MIIKYTNIIGRSPSSLTLKIGNLGRWDPELNKRGITGLANGGKLEKVIWDEFYGNWEDLAKESEKVFSQFQNKTILETNNIDLKRFSRGKRCWKIGENKSKSKFLSLLSVILIP